MTPSNPKNFRVDPMGSTAWAFDNFSLNFSKVVSTKYCYLTAFLWNIKLGDRCIFYGITHFKRYPCSEIIIGKYCRFRSSFRSNFVGMNRPCGLSTHSKNARITIGENCGFSGASIGAYDSITMEKNVLIGANTVVTDFDWHPIPNVSEDIKSAPVWIGSDVWIGMNCTVLKGVSIGRGSVIGANSVVTSSLPENIIAAGNPARVIRSIS